MGDSKRPLQKATVTCTTYLHNKNNKKIKITYEIKTLDENLLPCKIKISCTISFLNLYLNCTGCIVGIADGNCV